MRNPLARRERKIRIASIDTIKLDGRFLPIRRPRASVLLVHGFSVDLHEEGAFDRLATGFAESGIAVARFSFRGHGASLGTQDGMTIAGERLDVTAAYRWMTRNSSPPHVIVAASFGAVSTLLQSQALRPKPLRLVLWNPVLDLTKVFVRPVTEWGRRNFGNEANKTALEQGYSLVDDAFRVGQVFLDEVKQYGGNLGLLHLRGIPTLVFHGTRDTYVPIASTRALAKMSTVCIIEVSGSDHGFPNANHETLVLKKTVAWLENITGKT